MLSILSLPINVIDSIVIVTSSWLVVVVVAEAAGVKVRLQIKWAFAPSSDEHIALQEGDLVQVLEKNETGWWSGQLLERGGKPVEDGPTGWFPSNYGVVHSEAKRAPVKLARAQSTHILRLQAKLAAKNAGEDTASDDEDDEQPVCPGSPSRRKLREWAAKLDGPPVCPTPQAGNDAAGASSSSSSPEPDPELRAAAEQKARAASLVSGNLNAIVARQAAERDERDERQRQIQEEFELRKLAEAEAHAAAQAKAEAETAAAAEAAREAEAKQAAAEARAKEEQAELERQQAAAAAIKALREKAERDQIGRAHV